MAKFFFWRLLPWSPWRMGRRSASCYLLHLAAGPGVMKLEVEQGTPQGIPLQASLLKHWALVSFALILTIIYIYNLKTRWNVSHILNYNTISLTQNTHASRAWGDTNPTTFSYLFLNYSLKFIHIIIPRICLWDIIIEAPLHSWIVYKPVHQLSCYIFHCWMWPKIPCLEKKVIKVSQTIDNYLQSVWNPFITSVCH